MERALQKPANAAFLGKNIQGTGFDCEIYVHRGAGAYICGEETGMIESLEGKRPYPRIKPPYFPAVLGLYQCPTIVNNVETLCHVKHIIQHGRRGVREDRPTQQHRHAHPVRERRRAESPVISRSKSAAITMGELLYDVCGGPKEGRKFKAIIPGGSSAKVLRADEKFKIKEKGPDGAMVDKEITFDEIPMDFDTLAAVGSMAGSGGVIVMDDSRNMVETLANINEFYAHESCGQCTPCREGSLWMQKITRRMVSGEGAKQDPAVLKSVGRQHRRQDDLRVRRGVRMADAELRGQVPRGVRRQGAKERDPARGLRRRGVARGPSRARARPRGRGGLPAACRSRMRRGSCPTTARPGKFESTFFRPHRTRYE